MALALDQPKPSARARQVQLSGTHFVKRFDSLSSSGSSAIVMSAVLLLPASSLQFREHTWIKVSASPSSTYGAIVETCYRVYPGECIGPATDADVAGRPDTKTQEAVFVHQTLANNTRLGMQDIQNTLLSGEVFRQIAASHRT